MFSADVMSIIEAGTSLIVGTVGRDGEPRASRAFAITVVDDATNRVRVVLSADDPVVLEHLETSKIAVTAADVRTLRSVQLKGRITSVDAPTDVDQARLGEHSEAFFQAIHETDGHEVAVSRQLLPLREICVEMVVEELYDQTPGPTAGRPVALA